MKISMEKLASPFSIETLFGLSLLAALVSNGSVHAQTCSDYVFPYTVGTVQSDLVADVRLAVDCADDNGVDGDVIDLDGQTIVFDSGITSDSSRGFLAIATISTGLTIQNGVLERNTSLGCVDAGSSSNDASYFRMLRTNGSGEKIFRDLTIRNGCASDNTSSNLDVDGGGSYHTGSSNTITLINNHYEGNTATDDGAAMIVGSGVTTRIANSSFDGNSGDGALVFTEAATTANIVNSTITGSGGTFGGVTVSSATVEVTNSTISGNSINGIRQFSGTLTVNNSILANNSSNNCNGTIVSSHSFSDDSSCGFATNDGADDSAIALGPLSQVATGTVVFPLLGGPAIDGGDNAFLPSESILGIDVDGDGSAMDDPIDIDQFSNPRFAFASIDAGAFEATCADIYATPYTVGTIRTDLVADVRFAVDCADDNGVDGDVIDLDGQTIVFDSGITSDSSRGFLAIGTISTGLTIQNGVLERNTTLDCVDAGSSSNDASYFRMLRTNGSGEKIFRDLTVRNGCASDNTSSNLDVDGGGSYHTGSSNTITLINNHYEGNTATDDGGAMIVGSGVTTRIVNSSFDGNFGDGTLVFTEAATTARILNSTITGSAGTLGAVTVSDATLEVTNSTISGNSINGIRRVSGTLTVNNSILANNTSNNCNGTIVSNHSFSDDSSCGFATNDGADDSAIALGPLSQVATGTVVFPLLGGPAIDGGDNALLPNESFLGIDVDGDGSATDDPVDIDQAGNARIQSGAVDPGAYESALTTPIVTAVSIPNTYAVVGDMVTVTISVVSDMDDYTTGSGGLSASVAGYALTGFAKADDATYEASFLVLDGGIDYAPLDDLPVSLVVTNSFGTPSHEYTNSIDQDSDPIYANLPEVTLLASGALIFRKQWRGDFDHFAG